MSQAIAPLRLPYYRAIWLAALFSNIGSFFQTVAAAWLMKELTNSSATWVGLMLAANLLPLLFLALISGVVADTFDRTKVMLFAQSLMGSSAAAMAILTATKLITPGLLLGLGLVMGVGVAFNLPAWQALVPDLVPRGMVPSAVALNSAGFNVARAVGPALGGLIVAAAGPQVGFGLNAISYLAVIAVIAVVGSRLALSVPEHTSMTNSIAQSIRYARFTPAFRRLLALVALFAISSAAVQATLPNRTSELGGTETTYGVLLGFMGAGALVGAFVRPRLVDSRGSRRDDGGRSVLGADPHHPQCEQPADGPRMDTRPGDEPVHPGVLRHLSDRFYRVGSVGRQHRGRGLRGCSVGGRNPSGLANATLPSSFP
jgi:MFS family permease